MRPLLACGCAFLIAGAACPDAQADEPGGTGPGLAAAIVTDGTRADLGRNGTPDPAAAYRTYAVAAALGDPEAELDLGVMLDSGVGVPVDRAAAAVWYARAASRGEGRAGYDLALLYAQGDGVVRAPTLADAWFRMAAAHGVRAAAGRRVAPGAADGAPAAPVLSWPGASALTGNTVELVWQPGSGAPATRYWVEVAHAQDRSLPVVWTGTDLSAELVRLPPGTGRYAWRVMAASAQDGHYSSSAWREFSTDRLVSELATGG